MFVDCDETGADFDYDDLGAKLTARTRAIMPVYMWGRAADPAASWVSRRATACT